MSIVQIIHYMWFQQIVEQNIVNKLYKMRWLKLKLLGTTFKNCESSAINVNLIVKHNIMG